MKKLVLTYPNQRWQKEDMNTVWDLNPVTLCLLAAMVKDIVEVHIIDAQFYDMSREEFKNRLKEINPDYIGISILSSEYQDTLDTAIELAKEVNSAMITIAGGVHITTKHAFAFRNQDLDYGVNGEGEFVLKELLLYLQGKGEFPKKGLIYRDANAQVHVQEIVWVEDLNTLPWPDYSYINFEEYLQRGERIGPNRPPEYPSYSVNTTRGCPFGCSFCQVEMISGKKVRYKDPKNVVEEILFLKERYGIKSIVFGDDNMLMADGGRYAASLFQEMIDKEVNLRWVGTAFALFLLTDKHLRLMKESGCIGLNVAIESGTQRVLKQIVKKPIKDLKEVPNIIRKVKEYGMHCIANFIIGFPGETWEEIRETIYFAEHCGADYVKFFVAVPLYGTELYSIASMGEFLSHNDEFPKTDWRYSQIKSDEWSAQDISILRLYEWDRINFAPNRIEKVASLWGLSVEELNEIRKKSRQTLVF
ncbi:B12-binding domain-containing radical SAM protein [bacterium]|nr:B12-binding domain-containing radical SAM protein [bacterium]MBU1994486.1 B12-binding domain-containing radical SAM protein [bacterium]